MLWVYATIEARGKDSVLLSSTWLVTALVVLFVVIRLRRYSRGREFAIKDNTASPVLGLRGFMVIVLLGIPLSMLLIVLGKYMEPPATQIVEILSPWRRLDLHGQVLFAKPTKPEVLADLRGDDPTRKEAALNAIERINLDGRNLRQADLSFSILARGSLQKTKLNGANLDGAELQDANLYEAELQGANLRGAQLQGADLRGAQLQGADLRGIQLMGATLDRATIYGNVSNSEIGDLVDTRGLQWQPLNENKLEALQLEALNWSWRLRSSPGEFDDAIHQAAKADLVPPSIKSCLGDMNTPFRCAQYFSLDKFRKQLFPELTKLACESPTITHWLVVRNKTFGIPDEDSSLNGFAAYLVNKLKHGVTAGTCEGLASMSDIDKKLLYQLPHKERQQKTDAISTRSASQSGAAPKY